VSDRAARARGNDRRQPWLRRQSVRTGLPADELTCALPARDLADIVARLARSRAADAVVSAYANGDIRHNFTPA
jgi:hypothetical protein